MNQGLMQDVEAIAEGVDLAEESMTSKVVLAVIAVAIALVSFFLIADIMSSAETHSGSIQSLDEKKETVMGLVAASTAASAAVSLIPGDTGTPIAEKLVDISSDFVIVITAIYLEKYLLTTLGFAAFKILIPLACLLFAISLFLRTRPSVRQAFMRLSAKLALFGIAIFLVVPMSIWTSDMIESTYQDSVDATLALSEETTENIEATVSGEAAQADEQSATTPLDWIASIPENANNALTSTVSDLTADAQKALNGFVDALAMMIVTSCIIPILVLVFFLWLVKVILGIDVSAPVGMLRPRSLGGIARRM